MMNIEQQYITAKDDLNLALESGDNINIYSAMVELSAVGNELLKVMKVDELVIKTELNEARVKVFETLNPGLS